MRVEPVFLWGLAISFAALVGYVVLVIVLAALALIRKNRFRRQDGELSEELAVMVAEARRGGSQTSDFDTSFDTYHNKAN